MYEDEFTREISGTFHHVLISASSSTVPVAGCLGRSECMLTYEHKTASAIWLLQAPVEGLGPQRDVLRSGWLWESGTDKGHRKEQMLVGKREGSI